jgi:hypothetical protein
MADQSSTPNRSSPPVGLITWLPMLELHKIRLRRESLCIASVAVHQRSWQILVEGTTDLSGVYKQVSYKRGEFLAERVNIYALG